MAITAAFRLFLAGSGRGIDLKAAGSRVPKDLQKDITKDVDELFEDFNTELKKLTPKDTGRASRAWKKTGKYRANSSRTNTIIKNKTPYIDPLEKGHSKQAPNGMIDPAYDKVFNRKRR
jgi:hypothetical protein